MHFRSNSTIPQKVLNICLKCNEYEKIIIEQRRTIEQLNFMTKTFNNHILTKNSMLKSFYKINKKENSKHKTTIMTNNTILNDNTISTGKSNKINKPTKIKEFFKKIPLYNKNNNAADTIKFVTKTPTNKQINKLNTTDYSKFKGFTINSNNTYTNGLIKVIENEEENKFSPLRSPNRESTHSYKLSPISKGILKESNKRISKSPKRQSSKSNISILTEKEPIKLMLAKIQTNKLLPSTMQQINILNQGSLSTTNASNYKSFNKQMSVSLNFRKGGRKRSIKHYNNLQSKIMMLNSRQLKYKHSRGSMLYLAKDAIMKMADNANITEILEEIKEKGENFIDIFTEMDEYEIKALSETLISISENYQSSLKAIMLIKEIIYSLKFTFKPDFQVMIGKSLSSLISIFNCKKACIYIFKENQFKTNIINYTLDDNQNLIINPFNPTGKSFIEQLSHSNKIKKIDNVIDYKDKMTKEDYSIIFGEKNTIYCPILNSNQTKTYGIVQLINKNNGFSSDDESALELFNEILSMSIENTIYIANLKANIDLSNKVNKLYKEKSIQSDEIELSSKVNQFLESIFSSKNTKICFLNKEKDKFVSFYSYSTDSFSITKGIIGSVYKNPNTEIILRLDLCPYYSEDHDVKTNTGCIITIPIFDNYNKFEIIAIIQSEYSFEYITNNLEKINDYFKILSVEEIELSKLLSDTISNMIQDNK